MKVLVADDDTVTRLFLERCLARWGYDVISRPDGNGAWETLCQDDCPRLALLDWMMPGMDGLTICKQLRDTRKEPYVYLILLTQRSGREDLLAGLEAGADDYIIKPFDQHELHVRLKAGRRIVELQAEMVQAKEKLQAANEELRQALGDVRKLSGLLPICASCKKIRDDKGYWQQIEAYISEHSDAHFTHGLCPDCARKLYPGFRHGD